MPSWSGVRTALKAAVGLTVCGGGCAVAFEPGLRREALFWWHGAPIVAQYFAVRYMYDEGDEANARYQELHHQNAPRALATILELRGLFIKFGQV